MNYICRMNDEDFNIRKFIDYAMEASLGELDEESKRKFVFSTGKLGAIDAMCTYSTIFMTKAELEEYRTKLEGELPEGFYTFDNREVKYLGDE